MKEWKCLHMEREMDSNIAGVFLEAEMTRKKAPAVEMFKPEAFSKKIKVAAKTVKCQNGF